MTAANANPQQALQDEILDDARRRADETVGKARREADAALAKARADAESERLAALKAAEAEARRRHGLVLATIAIRVARRRAECVEAALEKVLAQARDLLLKRGGQDYPSLWQSGLRLETDNEGHPRLEEGLDYRRVLAHLAAEAIGCMEGSRFVLDLSAADHEAFGVDLAKQVADSIQGRPEVHITVMPNGPASGGVVVRDDEGRQVWDNGFEARLARLWPGLRHEIAAAAGLVSAAPPQKESP